MAEYRYFVFCLQAARVIVEDDFIAAEVFDYEQMRFVEDLTVIKRLEDDSDVQRVSEIEAWKHCLNIKKRGIAPTAADRRRE